MENCFRLQLMQEWLCLVLNVLPRSWLAARPARTVRISVDECEHGDAQRDVQFPEHQPRVHVGHAATLNNPTQKPFSLRNFRPQTRCCSQYNRDTRFVHFGAWSETTHRHKNAREQLLAEIIVEKFLKTCILLDDQDELGARLYVCKSIYFTFCARWLCSVLCRWKENWSFFRKQKKTGCTRKDLTMNTCDVRRHQDSLPWRHAKNDLVFNWRAIPTCVQFSSDQCLEPTDSRKLIHALALHRQYKLFLAVEFTFPCGFIPPVLNQIVVPTLRRETFFRVKF